MKPNLKIILLGDFDENITAHQCIPKALKIAAENESVVVESIWIQTRNIKNSLSRHFSEFDGVWCVPGSPYEDRNAVLEVIRFARTSKIPYLGTCGGYQHALLEFAINELGFHQAEFEEENPMATMPLISALSCRLVDEKRKIVISKNSKLSSLLNTNELSEEYRCGFGMNPAYTHLFSKSAMKFVAFNEEDVPQAFELESHPFFVGTAFQPERSSRVGTNHPLVAAFVRAAARE